MWRCLLPFRTPTSYSNTQYLPLSHFYTFQSTWSRILLTLLIAVNCHLLVIAFNWKSILSLASLLYPIILLVLSLLMTWYILITFKPLFQIQNFVAEKVPQEILSRKERLRKIRFLLDSSLMKLDDAIMLFHDFLVWDLLLECSFFLSANVYSFLFTLWSNYAQCTVEVVVVTNYGHFRS